MRYQLLLVTVLLLGCQKQLTPCSPAASLVLDEACVQAIAKAAEACPTAVNVLDCPESRAVADACGVLFDYQEARCQTP